MKHGGRFSAGYQRSRKNKKRLEKKTGSSWGMGIDSEAPSTRTSMLASLVDFIASILSYHHHRLSSGKGHRTYGLFCHIAL